METFQPCSSAVISLCKFLQISGLYRLPGMCCASGFAILPMFNPRYSEFSHGNCLTCFQRPPAAPLQADVVDAIRSRWCYRQCPAPERYHRRCLRCYSLPAGSGTKRIGLTCCAGRFAEFSLVAGTKASFAVGPARSQASATRQLAVYGAACRQPGSARIQVNPYRTRFSGCASQPASARISDVDSYNGGPRLPGTARCAPVCRSGFWPAGHFGTDGGCMRGT